MPAVPLPNHENLTSTPFAGVEAYIFNTINLFPLFLIIC